MEHNTEHSYTVFLLNIFGNIFMCFNVFSSKISTLLSTNKVNTTWSFVHFDVLDTQRRVRSEADRPQTNTALSPNYWIQHLARNANEYFSECDNEKVISISSDQGDKWQNTMLLVS